MQCISQEIARTTQRRLRRIERKFEMAVPYSSIQHNLDTSTSGSENGDESGGEDVVEGYLPRDEEIRPYMFEPETDNSDSSSDEEEMAREGDGGGRLENLDWYVVMLRKLNSFSVWQTKHIHLS